MKIEVNLTKLQAEETLSELFHKAIESALKEFPYLSSLTTEIKVKIKD